MLIPFFALIINAIVNGKSAVSNNKSNLSWYDNFVNPMNNCSISNLTWNQFSELMYTGFHNP